MRAESSTASRTPWAASDAAHPLARDRRSGARRAVEAVSEILSRVGYNGIAVEVPLERGAGADHTVKAYLVEDADAFAKVSDVRDALGHLQAFGLGPIGELVARRVDDKDWLESWKAEFVPIRIGAFLVRPDVVRCGSPVTASELVLDPGMAFGTGLHPTTQQCLEALSTLPLEGKSVLDVGTGSVLAIAAAKRGASPVVAVDTDSLAVVPRVRTRCATASRSRSVRGAPRRAGPLRRRRRDIVSPVLQRHRAGSRGATLRRRHAARRRHQRARGARDTRGPGVARLEVLDRTVRDDWIALALGR